MKEISPMKSKKYVTYAKKIFVMMKMRRVNLNCTINSEIIVITLENLEELPNDICNLRYKTPKYTLVGAHNAAYDHHFII